MHMWDSLHLAADVHDEFVVLADPELLCHFSGCEEERCMEISVARLHRFEGRDLALRHDQDMDRRSRMDVAKDDKLLVFILDRCRYLSIDDFGKNTGHNQISTSLDC